MPIRTIATLAVAVMLGLFAVVLVRNYVAKQAPKQEAQAVGTVPMVVAAREIKRGETLQPALLKVNVGAADFRKLDVQHGRVFLESRLGNFTNLNRRTGFRDHSDARH